MSTRDTLKRAREAITAGARDLYRAVEVSAATDLEVFEALELLEAQACPARSAQNAAALRWLETRDDASGLRAVELARLPGADQTLWTWIHTEGRRRGDVLELLARAILKTGKTTS